MATSQTQGSEAALLRAVAVLSLAATAVVGVHASAEEPVGPGEYRVRPLLVEHVVRQRGILTCADTSPALVKTRGRILEIVKQGTRVKEGDRIFEMDDSEARERIERHESSRDKEQLSLEILTGQLALVEYTETQELEVKRNELAHAKLAEEVELAMPDDDEIRLLEIEKELAALAMADAEDELGRQRRLFEKDFVSLSALEPFERRLDNARAHLEEVELKGQLRRKGITEERRIELRRAVESAESALHRAQEQMQRKLAEVRNQIVVSERRLLEAKHHLTHYQKEIDQSVTTAGRDGIVMIHRFRDWRSGGRLREYAAGDERYPQDIVAEVINPEVMRVKLVVNEADFHVLSKGTAVKITMPAFPGKLFHGKVEQLGAIGRDRNRIDPTARSGGSSDIMMFNAEISFSGGGARFQPGMSAMVEVVVCEPGERLVVPRSAVAVSADGTRTVQRKAEGSFAPAPVEGCDFNERYFHVTDGLSPGDVVLLLPPEAIGGR